MVVHAGPLSPALPSSSVSPSPACQNPDSELGMGEQRGYGTASRGREPGWPQSSGQGGLVKAGVTA